MSDDPETFAPPSNAIDREAYVTQVASEHAEIGFPEDVARFIAETATTIADEAQELLNATYKKHLDPIEHDYAAVVPYAVIRAASRLLASRFDYMAAQATDLISADLTPPPPEGESVH